MVVNPVRLGKCERMSYSSINEVLGMPNLIEVQKNSYKWFLKEGLKEVFRDVSPITDYTGNLILEFIDYKLDDEELKYTIEDCKERDATYSAPLKVKVRLINKETGEVKEQEIFMGDFPLMTPNGTFIINGAERVIVSQLVRSPGVYYSSKIDKVGKSLYSATLIPNRGAWLEFETDSNDVISVKIDRTRKLPITVFVRALGYGTDVEITELLGEDEKILATIGKDATKTQEEGLLEVYKRLRPGEPPNVESATSLLNSLFFDPKRYDLARVGRFKFNKKLSLARRIIGAQISHSVADPQTGEVIVEAGEILTREKSYMIQNKGINEVEVTLDGKDLKVIGNNTVCFKTYTKDYVDFDISDIDVNEYVRSDVLKTIIDEHKDKESFSKAVRLAVDELFPKFITKEDIVASVNYIVDLSYELGYKDDIDHLGNRRLRSVGELLQNQFRIGLSRMERVVRERMTIQDIDIATPQALINIRPVAASIKEFFGSSQLSQFMDQTNPLAELTHKRRLSALGPGGLSRERAGFEVRDVHHSHYGRMCPIETPEGPNIGLIGYLSTYSKVNEFGFMESPYRKVDKETGCVVSDIDYLNADEEDVYYVAQANEPLDENGRFLSNRVVVRYMDKILEVEPSRVDYMDVAPKQLVSVATAMIPFLENDDANRALMGANMQRQAVPLIKTDSPIVGTGIEHAAAKDSGVVVIAENDGVVDKVSANEIIVKNTNGTKDVYKLLKYVRSNQGTCINQRPICKKGEEVKKGDVIADGPSTDKGEIALGKNILIGFMTWEGYNYEDAILISEKLVKDDVFTSIHIEEYESEARDTKLGPEDITRDIPNVSEDSLKDLDERGVIRKGAEVRSGDILVGKVTPKGETELTAEERLLRAIFGEKAREVRDTSLRVPHGEAGIVVDVKIFTRENGDELSPGVNEMVRVYIAQKRKISVGDKMAGRHGNKGVISRILPEEDMPFLPDGTPLELVLNPLGVPSRMNIGQVLEVHLGYAAKALGWKIATPVFDGANEKDIRDTLQKAGIGYDKSVIEKVKHAREQVSRKREELEEQNIKGDKRKEMEEQLDLEMDKLIEKEKQAYDGKTILYDGRTGQPFDSRVTVGYMHILKLAHLVDDKIHARSTGPYSLVTQQPLGGKAQFGGQRFGEMEVWALEAYGAAYTLQEILTVKSDDVVGRVKTYESIVKGENVPEPGIPESFKVLIKELQSLALDVKVYSDEQEEIAIKESVDEEMEDLNVGMEPTEEDLFEEFSDFSDLTSEDIEKDGFITGDDSYTQDFDDITDDLFADESDSLDTELDGKLADDLKEELEEDLADDLDEDLDDLDTDF